MSALIWCPFPDTQTARAVAERLLGLNVETAPNTPAEFADFLSRETEKWGRLVREAGIKPD